MDAVVRLFGNEHRVRLIRFLVLNEKRFYTFSELEKKMGLSMWELKKEVEILRKSGFIRIKKVFSWKQVLRKKFRKKIVEKAISLTDNFPHLSSIRDFFVATAPLSSDMILKRLIKAGKVKMVVASGIFMENPDGRLDLLIVGDRLNKVSIDRAVRYFEMTLGKELRYAYFETPDFEYRMSVFDRLVRDVLDYPHRKILDKIRP